MFFETLTWFNEEDYSAQPSLAESWEWSDDSLSLTMKLKEGVNFFDGTPVNAEAVKTTMEYYMDPDTAHAQASYLANVDNVEVVDDYTVKFNFSAPDSSFLTAMHSQSVLFLLRQPLRNSNQLMILKCLPVKVDADLSNLVSSWMVKA